MKYYSNRFINEKQKDYILKLLDIILSYSDTNGLGSNRITSLMNNYGFEQLLSDKKSELLSICPIEIYQLIISKIVEISDKYDRAFDNRLVSAIEVHPQNMFF